MIYLMKCKGYYRDSTLTRPVYWYVAGAGDAEAISNGLKKINDNYPYWGGTFSKIELAEITPMTDDQVIDALGQA